MNDYNYETLNQVIGQQVTVEDSQGNTASLTLSELIKGKIDGEEWEAFSAIYQGDNQVSIPQGTYTLKHAAFGERQLFLSPNSETEYETVIARERDVAASSAMR